MSNATYQPSQLSTQSLLNTQKKPSTHGTSNRPKGNSKYANKKRSKKNQKPISKPRGPVNTYTSVCCSQSATKPPAASFVAPGNKDKTGLGKWRCSGCHKACSVTVSKFKASEAPPAFSDTPVTGKHDQFPAEVQN